MSSDTINSPEKRIDSPSVASPSGRSKSSINLKKKSSSLPPETVEYLKAWMMSPEHIAHPYPTEREKSLIMSFTGIELKQLTNWFVNNRKRYWKPRVEARLQQQAQSHAAAAVTALVKPDAHFDLDGVIQPSIAEQVRRPVPQPPLQGKEQREAVVTTDLSTFVPSQVQIRTVSDVSSSSDYSTESGSILSTQDGHDDDCCSDLTEEIFEGTIVRTEYTDVHILKPMNGNLPSVEDVSILSSVPSERILQTFERCALTYRFLAGTVQDRMKVQSRRDAEVVRMKRRYLKLYVSTKSSSLAKRMREDDSCDLEVPRCAFSSKSPRLWRQACQEAPYEYDNNLPSFEEATRLFGYCN